jgi:tripartite-type tricarboxylate transporter receptor subunit TctC
MPSNLSRRRFVQSGALAGAAALVPSLGFAQPAGTLRLNVGFPAGGPADTVARLVAGLMTEPGTNVIVENKAGASGQLAVDAVRRSGTDGTNLLVTPSSILTLVPHLYKRPMYNSMEDLVAVGGICDHSFGLAVNGSSPIRTVAEFMEAARKNPSGATYATAGNGTGMHLLGTLFTRETGINLVHVPYRGTAPGLQDLMGGQVFSTFNPLPTMLELHRAGKIRILAVTNPVRVATLRDVPTFTELKLPGLELVEWFGVFASSATTPLALQELRQRLSVALSKPELAVAARKMELEPRTVDAVTLRKMLETDNIRMAAAVKATGLSLES